MECSVACRARAALPEAHSMIVNADTLPPNFAIEADICVIGAGAAGITLARDLQSSGKTVAVLEGGGMDITAESQALYSGDVVGHPYTPLDRDRLRFFGGTTNHWSGSCKPFQSDEFDGWPFGADVMDAYYRRAQIVCQLGQYTYNPEDWGTAEATPIRLLAESRLKNGIFQYSPPTQFGSVYGKELAAAQSLTVYLNANVIEIETRVDTSAVTSLRVACFGGKLLRARARHYVLATGGIENARLLLNSDKVRTTGLGNENDLVGRYFMDHVTVPGAATVVADASRPEWKFYDQHLVGDQRIEGYLTATQDVKRREELPPFAIGLRPATAAAAEFYNYNLPASLRSQLSEGAANKMAFLVSRLITQAEASWDWMYNQMWRSPPGTVSTVFICGPVSSPASRVTLLDSVDAFGLRRAKLDWRLPRDFEIKMRRAHEIVGEELGRTGLARMRLESSGTGHDPMDDVGHGHHQMGTTRMNNDPRQGVVDEHCRVHNLNNLFVAGSSVFPSYACDDPTMTIVALALKLSDHLKTLRAG